MKNKEINLITASVVVASNAGVFAVTNTKMVPISKPKQVVLIK